MLDTTYRLPQAGTILGHSLHHVIPVCMLHDGSDDSFQNLELDAQVRSSDYFRTVATMVETIAESLPKRNAAAIAELYRLAGDLEYVQRRYAIVKRATAERPRPTM